MWNRKMRKKYYLIIVVNINSGVKEREEGEDLT